MIYHLKDLLNGFEVDCDVVVIGSGAGGAVAAENFSKGGLKTVLLEAGPRVEPGDMTRDAPKFLAKYFWDGGQRLVGGTVPSPSMAGRCLGGSTVMNSAIMYKLPAYVREEWANESNLSFLKSDAIDRAYERIFKKLKVTDTPMQVQGKRNLATKTALEVMGIRGNPLPRAVHNCHGTADCLTGCFVGHKPSVSRALLPGAHKSGCDIYTCSQVEKLLVDNDRVSGVEGFVIEPISYEKKHQFRVNAKLVIMAAGAVNTPHILLKSGIHSNHTIGKTFASHIGGGVISKYEEDMQPWVGATQGWGAMPEELPGLKFESLWAPTSVMTVKFPGIGVEYLKNLADIKKSTVTALLYRGRVFGSVKKAPGNKPAVNLYIPQSEIMPIMHGLKIAADGHLKTGAVSVFTSIGGIGSFKSTSETDYLLSGKIKARDLGMTLNHIFCSCPMSMAPGKGSVDYTGRVRGMKNLYICDASIFPSPSGVNPQATIMALSDMISRRLAEYDNHGLDQAIVV